MKTFELKTKIGLVHFRVNGANGILVDTNKYDEKHQSFPVIIRGLHHVGHVQFKFDGNEWDGITYASDGNAVVFVNGREMGNTEWAKIRSVYLNNSRTDGTSTFVESANAAKVKFYDEIKSALNEFCINNMEVISKEQLLRRGERIEAGIIKTKEKIEELNKELAEATRELAELTKEQSLL